MFGSFGGRWGESSFGDLMSLFGFFGGFKFSRVFFLDIIEIINFI